MKKQLILISVICMSLGNNLLLPAHAAPPPGWFDRYDHNHDGHWSWEEYRAWWFATHRNKHMSDEELRHHFDSWDRDHDGFVAPREVRYR